MKIKLIALFLALLMVVPMLISCSDGKTGSDVKETEARETQSSTEAENEFEYIDTYVSGLANEHNYDGITFTMIDDGSSIPEKYEISGILEDDALYNRYRELEEKFGITLDLQKRDAEGTDFENGGQMIADEVYRDVLSGGTSFDLVSGGAENCGKTLINNGALRSISDMPGFDFSQDWWIPDIEQQLSIGEDLFAITGKANSSHYFQPGLVIFSKRMMEDYNINEDLYQIVKDGEWTVDKMTEIASAIPANTSETLEGAYRYFVRNFDGYTFYIGAGYKLTQKDEHGKPFVNSALPGEQVDFIQKMSQIFGDATQNFDSEAYEKLNSESDIFSEDRILFTVRDLHHVSWLKETGVEFGLLPIPKKDASQKDYYAFSNGTWTKAFYFPVNLKDEVMSGVITEAMAALSEKYLEPAYYEKALQGRSTYDVQSREMLDIVYSSEVIELADMYKWGQLTDIINEAMLGDTDTIVSQYNVGAKMATNNIRSLLSKIEKNKK